MSTTDPTAPAAPLATMREALDERTRADRISRARKALVELGMSENLSRLAGVRDDGQVLRRASLDGNHEARLVACNVALRALADLWAVS